MGREVSAQTDAGSRFGRFAFVMATGIVSIAAQLLGQEWIAAALLGINSVAFPLIWLQLAWAARASPRRLLAELADRRSAPGLLTSSAATCVYANQVALLAGHPDIVAGLWIAAILLWAGLIYGFLALMTVGGGKNGLAGGIDGSWLLVVVATEALAILTTRTAFGLWPAEQVAFTGLCLFLLGGAFYVLILAIIIHRWLFVPMRPEQLTPPYWINMGAAAIATLAGARLLVALDGASALGAVRNFVFSATLLFWSLATWWIPLLAVLTVWRHRRGVPFAYRLANWSMVFPLGMYATATWRLAHLPGLSFLQPIPPVFLWIALFAWSLNFVGMMRAAAPAVFALPR